MLHGNMSYDRYTKQTIEESFQACRKGVDALLADPRCRPSWIFRALRSAGLIASPRRLGGPPASAKRDQIDIAGCQHACSVNRTPTRSRRSRHAGWEWIWHAVPDPWCRRLLLPGDVLSPADPVGAAAAGLSLDRVEGAGLGSGCPSYWTGCRRSVHGFIQFQHSAEGVAWRIGG